MSERAWRFVWVIASLVFVVVASALARTESVLGAVWFGAGAAWCLRTAIVGSAITPMPEVPRSAFRRGLLLIPRIWLVGLIFVFLITRLGS